MDKTKKIKKKRLPMRRRKLGNNLCTDPIWRNSAVSRIPYLPASAISNYVQANTTQWSGRQCVDHSCSVIHRCHPPVASTSPVVSRLSLRRRFSSHPPRRASVVLRSILLPTWETTVHKGLLHDETMGCYEHGLKKT